MFESLDEVSLQHVRALLVARWLITFLCIIAPALAASAAEVSPHLDSTVNRAQPYISIHVDVAQVARYPMMTETEIILVLDSAKTEFIKRFGIPISFDWESSDLDSWENESEWFRSAGDQIRHLASSESDPPWWLEYASSFLSRWNLSDLIAYIPDSTRSQVRSYRDVSTHLREAWRNKLRGLMAPDSGAPLIDPDHTWQHSVNAWIVLTVYEESITSDLILTNVLTVMDDLRKPYPHSIFKMAKAGGFSFTIHLADSVSRGATYASAFDALSTDSRFTRDYGDVPREKRLAIFGQVVIAHELGHAIFGLGDYYSGHDSSCLMSTPPNANRNITSHEILERNPGICSVCRPYIESCSYAILGGQQRLRGEFNSAISNLQRAKRIMPRDIGYRAMRLIWINENIRLARAKRRTPSSSMRDIIAQSGF